MNKSIKVPAVAQNWNKVYNFLKASLLLVGADDRSRAAVLLAGEEIFINISRYAYPKGNGTVNIDFSYSESERSLKIKFTDSGIKFDPTKVPAPNLSLGTSQRQIGGLGIFMVKKMTDAMEYAYSLGKNNLVLIKFIDKT